MLSKGTEGQAGLPWGVVQGIWGPETQPDSSPLFSSSLYQGPGLPLLEPLQPLPQVHPSRSSPVQVAGTPQAPGREEAQITGPGSLEMWAPAPEPLRSRSGGVCVEGVSRAETRTFSLCSLS